VASQYVVSITQDGQIQTRKPLLVNLARTAALVLLAFILYVLCYPLAVRIADPGRMDTMGYQPVEWLIDNTALLKPMLRWSGLCGAGTEVSVKLDARKWAANPMSVF